MPSFNLSTREWIVVENLDGSVSQENLQSIFEKASTIRCLLGKPVEVAVIYRLLVAITTHSLHLKRDQDWDQAWNDLGSSMAKCAGYISSKRDYFDLYDLDRPFLQHPSLPFGSKGPNVLVYDLAQGNNPIFLDGTIEANGTEASSAEAARSLLVNFSFGGSHPDKSNPLAKPGQTTMFAGPLCARLVVILEGKSLAESLLLNLGDPTPQELREGKHSLNWEFDPPNHPDSRQWRSVLDLFTRRTRFIRLTPSNDGTKCIGVALHMGEGIEGDIQDPMIPRYLASDKQFKDLRLDPGKSLWRSLHVLLNCKDSEGYKPILAMKLLLDRKDHVSGLQVKMRILGVAGNAQGPKTEMWRDETLPFNLDLADKSGRHFVALERCLNLAEEGAKKLRARLSGFAEAYLSLENPNPNPEDVKKLVEELSPNLIEYWSRLSSKGERLALEVDEQDWQRQVQFAQEGAYQQALVKIPDTARKYQAAANPFSKKGKQKKS